MLKKLRSIAEHLQQVKVILTEVFYIIFITRKIYVILISVCMLLQGDPLGVEYSESL